MAVSHTPCVASPLPWRTNATIIHGHFLQNVVKCKSGIKRSITHMSRACKTTGTFSVGFMSWVPTNTTYRDGDLTLSRLAQSVSCLATGWTTERSRFDPWQKRKDFSSSFCVQTSSGAHPATCKMGTGVLSPGLKCDRGVTLTTHPHIVPRSRMSRSYTPLHPSSSLECSGTALTLTSYSVSYSSNPNCIF
jgi:hypothetical protein